MVATAGSDDMKALTAGAKKRKAAGNTEPVVVHVTTDASISSVLLTLPGSSFAFFCGDSGMPLKIDAGLAVLTFQTSSVNAFSRAAGTGDVTFRIQALDKSALSPQAQEAIGNHPVYSFAVTAGGTTMTGLAGTVKISIPYTPTLAELDGQAIIIYYIKADGTLALVSDCKYDPFDHAVTFLTDHFLHLCNCIQEDRILGCRGLVRRIRLLSRGKGHHERPGRGYVQT